MISSTSQTGRERYAKVWFEPCCGTPTAAEMTSSAHSSSGCRAINGPDTCATGGESGLLVIEVHFPVSRISTQNATVYVLDEVGEIVSKTLVQESGRACAQLTQGIYKAVTSAAGFKTVITPVEVHTDKHAIIHVKMRPTSRDTSSPQ